jgi:hypothetical protein
LLQEEESAGIAISDPEPILAEPSMPVTLAFFQKEIAPSVYNKGIADARVFLRLCVERSR